MNAILWYLAALDAALVWGVHYPSLDNALKRLSPFSLLFLNTLPIIFFAPFCLRTLAADYRTLAALEWDQSLLILAPALTNLLACMLLFISIDSKNATLASLIEISYPVFVVAFAYLLFRELYIKPNVAVGGILIFVGVTLIILNSP